MRASGGVRIEWTEIPAGVRTEVEGLLGAEVVEATNQAGGFSPGLAARCRLSDGRRVFVKAVSPEQNPQAPRIHRREAEVGGLLPAEVAAPRLRHVHDDGRWVVLVFDEVDGRQPGEPWSRDDLDAVVPAVLELAGHRAPDGLESAAARHEVVFRGWRRLAGGDGDADRLDDWTRAHLDRLADLEEGWVEASRGTSLVHADIRADNLLIGPGGEVTFVDWPWACAGAPFLDLVFMLPSVGLGGGPSPVEVIERHGLLRTEDPDAVRATAVALTGFFQRSALDPAPSGLPLLRPFQQAQADVALGWLSTMVGP